MASVLEGVKVVDLSSGIAGPVAGMLLAGHGADGVKAEPPGGDPRPGSAGGDPGRGSAGYAAWLRGRRSAELDLNDAGDRATFLTLVSDADVVLESFAPGTTTRLGIDAATLLGLNPRLVHCSITGYGSHPA